MNVPLRAAANTDAAGKTGNQDRQGEAAPDTGEVVRLHEALYRTVDPVRVPAAFSDEAPKWLGEPTGPRSDGVVDYASDLELRVGPQGRALFRKSAIVRVGPPRRAGESWIVPIEWRAATLAPLFPVFVGSLSVGPTRLAIDGYYAPPFGVVGHVLDRALLSIAARATAHWFLVKVAGAVG